MSLLLCPSCQGKYIYQDGFMYVCPECGHEWSSEISEEKEEGLVVLDTHGTRLEDGDSVTVIKDLKVRGSSDVLKRGTIIKNIRLIEGDHNVDCKIPGFGGMELKSEFLKKI